jgi:lipoate synthase
MLRMNTDTSPISLFLRTDGTLMLANAQTAVEIALTPEQLLKLGVDMLSIATRLQPTCMAAAVEALSSTYIVQPEEQPCPQKLN